MEANSVSIQRAKERSMMATLSSSRSRPYFRGQAGQEGIGEVRLREDEPGARDPEIPELAEEGVMDAKDEYDEEVEAGEEMSVDGKGENEDRLREK